jgi:hypothetical protein
MDIFSYFTINEKKIEIETDLSQIKFSSKLFICKFYNKLFIIKMLNFNWNFLILYHQCTKGW